MLNSNRPLTEKERVRWERVREGGRKRYILVYGVLFWGCLTALLFSSMPLLFGNSPGWIRTVLSFVLFPSGGIGFGRTMWNYMEDRYALGEHDLAN